MRRVYLITGGGHTKVGCTGNVEHCLRGLQVGNPAPLRLVLIAEGGHRLERAFHELLAPRHVRGKWYAGEITLEEARWLLAQADQRTGGQ